MWCKLCGEVVAELLGCMGGGEASSFEIRKLGGSKIGRMHLWDWFAEKENQKLNRKDAKSAQRNAGLLCADFASFAPLRFNVFFLRTPHSSSIYRFVIG